MKTYLKNGMEVLFLNTNTSSESLLVGTCIRVGLVDEPIEKAGISHFLEHLLFIGTSKLSRKMISQSIENLGGIMNGMTFDYGTCYYIDMPRLFIETPLDILSDMMADPLLMTDDALKSEQFNIDMEKERQVIVSEIRGDEGDARDFTYRKVIETLFQNPIFQMTPAGTEQTLSNITKQDLRKHFKEYYNANSMFLVIVGNIGSEVLLDLLNEKFSKIKKGKEVTRKNFQEEKISSNILKEFTRDFGLTHVALSFKAPERTHPDSFIFEVIKAIYYKGLSGRLPDAIRHEEGFAYSVSCWNEASWKHGIFSFYASVKHENSDKVSEIMVDQVEKMKGITIGEISDAINHILGRRMLQSDDVGYLFGELALANCIEALDMLFLNYETHISTIDLNLVKNAIKTYCINYVIVKVKPPETKPESTREIELPRFNRSSNLRRLI
jgi:predicted Zn-dependent peptidase